MLNNSNTLSNMNDVNINNNININNKLNTKIYKLTEPKVFNILIKSLKDIQKQQKAKRKNYKKLINSFSIKAQKYDDSSSNAELDIKKSDNLLLLYYSKKRKNVNSNIIDSNNNEYYSYNSDSSIYNTNKEDNANDALYNNNVPRNNFYNKSIQNEKLKFIKHKFKQIDQKNSKKFTLENRLMSKKVYSNLNDLNKQNTLFETENSNECDCSNNNNYSFSQDQKEMISSFSEKNIKAKNNSPSSSCSDEN